MHAKNFKLVFQQMTSSIFNFVTFTQKTLSHIEYEKIPTLDKAKL